MKQGKFENVSYFLVVSESFNSTKHLNQLTLYMLCYYPEHMPQPDALLKALNQSRAWTMTYRYVPSIRQNFDSK